MKLAIEQPCPNCGAEIILAEDEKLVQCTYCDVDNYMVHTSVPRYILPVRLPNHISPSDLLYVPYMRFKGAVYFCQSGRMGNKLIDTSRRGIELRELPVSLGLRPQAMKVLPVVGGHGGRYIRQQQKTKDIFKQVISLTMLFAKHSQKKLLHRSFIGETISRVYLPLYSFRGKTYDAVQQQPLGSSKIYEQLSKHVIGYQRSWQPSFLSTLCPECGDAMMGTGRSLVLTCPNCNRVYVEDGGAFAEIDSQQVAAEDNASVYLPFWQLEVATDGSKLESLADFMELTRQPVVVRAQHREKKMQFIIPAFKVKPESFLQFSRRLTVRQLQLSASGDCRLENVYPANLSAKEAMQSLKSVLVASSVHSGRVLEALPTISFSLKKKTLLYLPFTGNSHDYVQQQTGVSIPSALLRFGKSL